MELKQTPLRLPAELLAKIDERAAASGLSRNAWIVAALEMDVERPVRTRTKRERI